MADEVPLPAQLYPRDHGAHPPSLSPDYKSTVLRAPRLPLLSLAPTLSECTGPVFRQEELSPLDADLLQNHATTDSPIGERTIVHGRVIDEEGRPLAGSLVEIWQANAGGRYRHLKDSYLAPLDRNFGGCGRCLADENGWYRFRTIKPGPYPWPNRVNDWRPAHIHFSLFGHAFAQRLVTQMYFEGDPLVARCPIAQSIPDKAALDRLVAPLDLTSSTPFDHLAYRFDIVLRGRRQTPFETRLEGL